MWKAKVKDATNEETSAVIRPYYVCRRVYGLEDIPIDNAQIRLSENSWIRIIEWIFQGKKSDLLFYKRWGHAL